MMKKNQKYLVMITSERSFYWQSYIDRIDDIQTTLKPLKKWEKIYIYTYDHSRTS